jgi:hypothetical protein
MSAAAILVVAVIAALTAATLTLVMRRINTHVNEAIDRHVARGLAPRDGFDVHVDQALGILPRQRDSADDNATQHHR